MDDPDGKTWCPTKTDNMSNFISEEWGHCSDNCAVAGLLDILVNTTDYWDPHNCRDSCSNPHYGCRACTNPEYFKCT